MGELEVLLLGPVEVSVDSIPVELTRPQERGLLGRLALEPGRTVSADRLIDDLWGESLPRNPTASLQGLVYRLRRSLDGSGASIGNQGGGYTLTIPPDRVDVVRFEGLVAQARRPGIGDQEQLRVLQAATCLWRGEPFCGIEAMPFVSGQRTRLLSIMRGATGDRIDAELRQGNHLRLVEELDGLIASDPHYERYWAQVILALYRCRAQAAALK